MVRAAATWLALCGPIGCGGGPSTAEGDASSSSSGGTGTSSSTGSTASHDSSSGDDGSTGAPGPACAAALERMSPLRPASAVK